MEKKDDTLSTACKLLLLSWIALLLGINALLVYIEAPQSNALGKGWSPTSNTAVYAYPFIAITAFTFFITSLLVFRRGQGRLWLALLLLVPALIMGALTGAMLEVGEVELCALAIYIAAFFLTIPGRFSQRANAIILLSAVTISMLPVLAAHVCPKWWEYGHHHELVAGGQNIMDYDCKCNEQKTGTTRYYEAPSGRLVSFTREDGIKPGDTTMAQYDSDGRMVRLEKDTIGSPHDYIISYKAEYYPGGNIQTAIRYTTNVYETKMYSRGGAIRIYSLYKNGSNKSYQYDTIQGRL